MITNKKIILYFVHIAPLVLLSGYTASIINNINTFTFILFSLVFILNLILSLHLFLKFGNVFFYTFNIFLTLGFLFKFSVHEIIGHSYIEPIGTFDHTYSSRQEFLYVSICGVLGIILAQLFTSLLSKKDSWKAIIDTKNFDPCRKKLITSSIIILIVSTIMAYANLRYNILLFGLAPDIKIPFKGNVVYFLFLTRGLIFLLFYYVIDKITWKNLLIGSTVASIASIGVMSRMIILSFFTVIFLALIKEFNSKKIKDSLVTLILTLFFFCSSSYLTVKFSTDLRVQKYNSVSTYTSQVTRLPSSQKSNAIKSYTKLALERWIGVEGVMAVISFKNKGLKLFFDGLIEKSYNGKSFYTKISMPNTYNELSENRRVRSTSVPGPIAFFYYPGSLLFLVVALLVTLFLFNQLFSFFNRNSKNLVGMYIATFMTFDFIQFGISPIAFSKYWGLCFLSIALFYKRKVILNTIKKSTTILSPL